MTKHHLDWQGNPKEEENHRHDYRWISNKKEKEEWINKNYKPKQKKNFIDKIPWWILVFLLIVVIVISSIVMSRSSI